MIKLNRKIKQQFQIVLEKIPKTKIPQLTESLKDNKLNSSSSIYQFKNELHLSDSQIKILKETLALIPDPVSAGILFELLNEIRESNQTHIENTQLVMTSPLIESHSSATMSTMLNMIKEAKSKITIVGYVVFDGIEPIFEALSNAANNGIHVDFLFDKAHKHQESIHSMWKSNQKPTIYSYKPRRKGSSLHAKVLIIDDNQMLVTSANLTGNAIETNIEMGIIHKGKIVKDAKNLFESLIQEGFLVKLS